MSVCHIAETNVTAVLKNPRSIATVPKTKVRRLKVLKVIFANMVNHKAVSRKVRLHMTGCPPPILKKWRP